jgi:hypothetical protein
MHAIYHRQITYEVTQALFAPEITEIIIAANLGQDGLTGQIGHPEYHFDNNAFILGQEYIESQRLIAMNSAHSSGLSSSNPRNAWQALGRLLHAAQDFYAHSNYAFLWLDSHKGAIPEEIDPLDPHILDSPSLRSGRTYYPLELLSLITALRPMALRLLPHDSHTWMNLDSPEQGPLFAYALCAARKRSSFEVGLIVESQNSQASFLRW